MRMVLKKDTVLDYLLCFVLIMNMETIYFKRNDMFSALFEVTLCIALCIYISFSPSNTVLSGLYYAKVSSVAGLYLIILLITYYHGGEGSILSNMLQKVAIFVIIVPLVLLLIKKKTFRYVKEVLLVRYVNLFFALSLLGFIFWTLSSIGVALPSITVPYSWGGNKTASGIFGLTFNIYLSDQSFSQGFYRFTFMLVEGPIAISYFALMAVIEMSCNVKPRLYVVLFFALCVFCTFTGFGMILMAPIVALGLLTSQSVQLFKKSSYISHFLYFVIILGLIIIAPLVSLNLLSKKENTSSTELHVADFVGGYRAFKENPLLGYGIGNYAPLHEYADNGLAGTSSAFMMGLVQGGVIFVLSIILPIIVSIVAMLYYKQYRLAILPVFAFVFYMNGLSDNSPIFALIIALCIYYAIFLNRAQYDRLEND